MAMTKRQARALLAVVRMQVDGDVIEHLIYIGEISVEEATAFWALVDEARTVATEDQ